MPPSLPPRRGRGRGRGRGLVLVLTRFLLGLVAITAGPCPGGRATIRKFTIDGPEDAASFARDVACDGGVFEAVWMGGTVSLLGAIVVGRGTSVTVRGGATPAVIDAGGSSRIFSVASNADLHLEDIILQNGWSEGDGGAIYAPEGAAVTCVRCKLLASQAQRGGGIYLGSGSTFFMAGPSAIISGNRAEEGGGVYGSNCTSLTMEEGSSVENNSAIVKGGGISLSQSPLNIFGDGSIHGNMAGSNGGGVFLHGSILTMDELSIIVDNRALAYAGGVVLEQMSVVTLRGDSSVVSNHADGIGGGLCVYDDSILYVQDNGRIMDNSAAYGGGVFLTNAGTTLSMSAHASIVGNSAANDGGGVYMQGGSLLMSDSAVLVRNSARTSGGGVYALLNCAITMEATSSISENSGTWGGGLFVALSSTLTMAGDSLVANNTADDSGGGIYLADSATMNMKDRAVITRNVAQGNGGGIFSRGSIYMGNGASVSHCEARNSGGGIYVFRGSADMSQESGVHHNLADGDGGGISIYWGSTLRVQDRSSIAGNAAGISGGGISIKKESRVELSGIITISENAAVGTGGGLAVGEGISEVVITSGNIYFSNNSAVAGGGAAFIGAMSTFRASEAAGKVLFEGNWGARGGAILADDLAQVHLEESVTVFRRNDAKCCTARNGDGGGGRSCVDVDTLADAVSSFGFTACCARGEYATLDGRCEECGRAGTIVGADCTALQSMLGAHESSLPLMGGYWSANDATPIVRACWVEGVCTGGVFTDSADDFCAEGHSGPYCATCSSGFASAALGVCLECSHRSNIGPVLVLASLLVIAAALLLWIAKLVVQTGEPSNADQDVIASGSSSVIESKDMTENIQDAKQTTTVSTMALLKSLPWAKLRIPLVVSQILTQYLSITGLRLPQLYENFLAWIGLVNFDLGFLLSTGCLVRLDFYERLLLATLLPIAVAAFLGFLWLFAKHKLCAATGADDLRPSLSGIACGERAGQSRHDDWRLHPTRLEAIRERLTLALLTFLFLIYSTVSAIVFSIFACDSMEELGTSYLRADYAIECQGPKYRSYQIYGVIMVFVYPFGIPALFTGLLRNAREELQSGQTVDEREQCQRLRQISFLWKPYRSHCAYWEVVECGRRLLLTGLLAFVYAGTAAQSAVACIFAVITQLVFASANPLPDKGDRRLYNLGCFIIFLSMFLALVIKVNVADEDTQAQNSFAVILIVMNVILLVATLIQIIFGGYLVWLKAQSAALASSLWGKSSVEECEQELTCSLSSSTRSLKLHDCGSCSIQSDSSSQGFPRGMAEQKEDPSENSSDQDFPLGMVEQKEDPSEICAAFPVQSTA